MNPNQQKLPRQRKPGVLGAIDQMFRFKENYTPEERSRFTARAPYVASPLVVTPPGAMRAARTLNEIFRPGTQPASSFYSINENKPQTTPTATTTPPATSPTQQGGGYTSPWANTGSYTQGDMSGYGDMTSSPATMTGTKLSTPSPFGEKYQTVESLLALRDKMSMLREKAYVGEELDEQDIKDITGSDYYSPEDLAAIEKSYASAFEGPISYIDAIYATELKKQQATGGLGGMLGSIPNEYRDDVWKLRTEYENNPTVKDYKTMAPAYTYLSQIDPNTASNSDAQAALIQFTKSLDPTSVVREGELALTTTYAMNPSLANQLKQSWNKYINGEMINPQALRQIIAAFQTRYGSLNSEFNNIKNMYGNNLQSLYGMDAGTANALFNDYTSTSYGSNYNQGGGQSSSSNSLGWD